MLDINKITLSITLKFSENVISISAMVSAEHQAHICSRSKFTAHLIAVINLWTPDQQQYVVDKTNELTDLDEIFKRARFCDDAPGNKTRQFIRLRVQKLWKIVYSDLPSYALWKPNS